MHISKKRMVVLIIVMLMMELTACSSSSKDTTAPTIELISDEVVYYTGDTYDPMSYVISAADDSEEEITVQFDDGDIDRTEPGEYTIRFTAVDSSGNSSEELLKLIVKKRYSREEIKQIAQSMIDNEYFTFELMDDLLEDENEYIEGYLCGAIEIYGDFDENVFQKGSDIYTYAYLDVFLNENNLGVKNANVNTVNSELLIDIIERSNDTKLYNVDFLDISSDEGKIKLSNAYRGGCYSFYKADYYPSARTLMCFESEDQIEQFKKVISSSNVSIKIHRENGTERKLALNNTICENWLKTIQFYEDINEYVENEPNNNPNTAINEESQKTATKTDPEDSDSPQTIPFDLLVVYEDDIVKIELAQFYEDSVWLYGSSEPVVEKHVIFKVTNKGDKEFLFNFYNAYINDEAVNTSLYSSTNSGPKPGRSSQYDYGVFYDTRPDATPLNSLDELYGLEGTFELAIKDGDFISGHKKLDFSLEDMDLH